MKRRNRVRFQREREREREKFIALLFPSSSQLKTWSLHLEVVQGRQTECTKKCDARAELLFNLFIKPIVFRRSRCCPRRTFVPNIYCEGTAVVLSSLTPSSFFFLLKLFVSSISLVNKLFVINKHKLSYVIRTVKTVLTHCQFGIRRRMVHSSFF